MVVDSDEPTSLIGAAASPPWSMVAINNNNDKKNPVIFPPSNHENLLIHIDDPDDTSLDSDLGSDSDSNSNSSSTFSTPWDSPVCSSPKTAPLVPKQKVDSWYVTLCSKLSIAVRFLWSARGVFMSFRYAVVVVGFLYYRQRRRLRAGEENRARLIGVVKERDEKISQLLDQISRMNRVLLELHRVPSTT